MALLDANASTSERDATGRTIFGAAARCGHLTVVRILVAAKADVNAPLAFKASTALQAAAEGGQTDVVQYLVENGANIFMPRLFDKKTAKQLAEGNGYHTIADILKSSATRHQDWEDLMFYDPRYSLANLDSHPNC
jgi:ankyrin repeat protein